MPVLLLASCGGPMTIEDAGYDAGVRDAGTRRDGGSRDGGAPGKER